jgi:hypothetical protein
MSSYFIDSCSFAAAVKKMSNLTDVTNALIESKGRSWLVHANTRIRQELKAKKNNLVADKEDGS